MRALRSNIRRQHDLRSRRALARRKNKTSANGIYAVNYVPGGVGGGVNEII